MMLDSSGFYERVCEATGSRSAPEIARILGISKQTVYGWERGKMPGLKGLKNIVRVCEVGNVSLEWLLTGTRPKAAASGGATNRLVSSLLGRANRLIGSSHTRAAVEMLGAALQLLLEAHSGEPPEEEMYQRAVRLSEAGTIRARELRMIGFCSALLERAAHGRTDPDRESTELMRDYVREMLKEYLSARQAGA